jgi:hypothetical protein
VPNAGLVAPAELAQKLGVRELVDERVRLTRPGKALTVAWGDPGRRDSIDDTEAAARRRRATAVRPGPGAVDDRHLAALLRLGGGAGARPRSCGSCSHAPGRSTLPSGGQRSSQSGATDTTRHRWPAAWGWTRRRCASRTRRAAAAELAGDRPSAGDDRAAAEGGDGIWQRLRRIRPGEPGRGGDPARVDGAQGASPAG